MRQLVESLVEFIQVAVALIFRTAYEWAVWGTDEAARLFRLLDTDLAAWKYIFLLVVLVILGAAALYLAVRFYGVVIMMARALVHAFVALFVLFLAVIVVGCVSWLARLVIETAPNTIAILG
ncbi:hypothetical protein COU20_03200 [Candidatus Kaiserbacteria bacterium CG10_big_fil_rev_8_21_14_0_10_59_10]|uniref:Uncharacterized protein n=1 Tax=Candidatus Kaiserbacteria bacterium CG10_big_fil_rev_8_21_14_0_10_59_10 TaxID=1974612 RepID=A0A2H0U7H8_9BACT|nr:MAG: hypothetical protein COU20_03200 [Candidatus Kaiserbacteria bacterium CG10_big_fil_rev_8_21_14_0_10_59_10]